MDGDSKDRDWKKKTRREMSRTYKQMKKIVELTKGKVIFGNSFITDKMFAFIPSDQDERFITQKMEEFNFSPPSTSSSSSSDDEVYSNMRLLVASGGQPKKLQEILNKSAKRGEKVGTSKSGQQAGSSAQTRQEMQSQQPQESRVRLEPAMAAALERFAASRSDVLMRVHDSEDGFRATFSRPKVAPQETKPPTQQSALSQKPTQPLRLQGFGPPYRPFIAETRSPSQQLAQPRRPFKGKNRSLFKQPAQLQRPGGPPRRPFVAENRFPSQQQAKLRRPFIAENRFPSQQQAKPTRPGPLRRPFVAESRSVPAKQLAPPSKPPNLI